MIRGYKGIWPKPGARSFVDESAQVIGDVELGDDASVWMSAVVRGDVNDYAVNYVGYKNTHQAGAEEGR